MQSQPAQDRRKHPRRDASLVVSYRPKNPPNDCDTTQTQNVSQGGILLTTARAFERGVQLAIQLRLTPRVSPHLAEGTAEAVKSTELVRSLIYETRLRFIKLDRRSLQIIADFCAGEATPAGAAA